LFKNWVVVIIITQKRNNLSQYDLLHLQEVKQYSILDFKIIN